VGLIGPSKDASIIAVLLLDMRLPDPARQLQLCELGLDNLYAKHTNQLLSVMHKE
jgi:hypothetical protein